MKAYCLIRSEPHYRRDAFVAGLTACGYKVETSYQGWPVERGDVLVTWNRYGMTESIADKFEAAGGTVLVAENGYLGPAGVSPHGMNPRSIYALARRAHNGRGQWHVGGPERFAALGVELQPWRRDGDYILVCPNRSFGMSGGVMPQDWALDVTRRLQAVTKRPIRIRAHPGNYDSKVPLAGDLRRAWACVIWSSSCGVQALVAGVPVISEAPWWICHGAALKSVERQAELPLLIPHVREIALKSLAWAQWNVDEISSGEPFRYLLSGSWQTQGAAAV